MDTDPVADIKAKLDIVEFISQYVTLKKAGINMQGLCPFHDERTPSFSVSPERQTFKCFGCGKGGDIFSFVMEREGVDFPAALRLLAEKSGVTLPERNEATRAHHDERTQLFSLNEATAEFWHTLFTSHSKADAARQYILNKRAVPKELAKQFMIGIAPSKPTTTAYLKKKGFTDAQMRTAGDPARFAGRITFPICDITGRVVGFTGRIMPSREAGVHGPSGPKYWNTPETPVFKKSQTLYGLHIAKETIRKTGIAILAEGQMDVIGLHMAGLTNAVASSGTALTEQHISIIKRFATELVFAFDADNAGQTAAQKGFALALEADLTPTVLALPNGEDPGSLAVKDAKTLTQLYENRQPIIRWLLTNAVATHSPGTPAGKRAISKAVLPWIAKIPDAVERRAWLDVVAEEIHIATTALDEELRKQSAPKTTPAPRAATNDAPTAPAVIDALTLVVGIIGLHPSLAAPYSNTLRSLTAATPYEAVIPHLLAASAERTPLERPAQLALDDAIAHVEREYGQLTIAEFTSELDTMLHRAVTDHNHAVTSALSQQIATAEESGDTNTLNTLMTRLRSDTLNPPYE